MSEYIRTNKFDTNECPNIFVKEKLIRTNVRIYICDQYIRIFEYIRHTLIRSVRLGISNIEFLVGLQRNQAPVLLVWKIKLIKGEPSEQYHNNNKVR